MKKKLLITFFVLIMHLTFAEISIQKLTSEIEKACCFEIATEKNFWDAPWNEPKIADRYQVTISYNTNEKFLQSLQVGSSAEICNGKSIQDLKAELRNGTNIYGYAYGVEYEGFRWVEGRHMQVSIHYTLHSLLWGAGIYVFSIFDKDGIYSVCIRDIVNTYERNSDYDALSEYFFFREGQKADYKKGQEQVQGYVCKSEEAAEKFYKALLSEAPGLPESVLKFQRAARLLEKIIIEL